MSEKDKTDSLSERIKDAHDRKGSGPDGETEGRNVGYDLIGSVVGCGIVGAFADRAFQTTPWVMLGMIFVGFAVGMTAVWRSYQKPGK